MDAESDARARAAAATWTLWGFALALLGLANLAVMGFDPVPRQHAVVGVGIPVVMLLAGLATQALWPQAPHWTWLGAWLAGTALAFGSSAAQTLLGEAFLYGLGDAGVASQEAPFALFGGVFAAALTLGLRRAVAWWPGALTTVLLLGLYVWASSWGWGSEAGGAKLFGGAVLNGLLVVAFAAGGWATALASRLAAQRRARAGAPATSGRTPG